MPVCHNAQASGIIGKSCRDGPMARRGRRRTAYPPRPPPIPEKRSISSLAPASKGVAGALIDSRDGCHKLDAIHETPINTPRVTLQYDADESQPTDRVATSTIETACDNEVVATRDESNSNGRGSERIQILNNTKELRDEKARDCGPADEITWDAFDKRGDEPPDLTLIPTDEILGDCQERSESVSLGESSTSGRDITSTSREVRDEYHFERLQARIERRRQVHRAVTVEDNSHDYKTLRSSRIKQIRGIYQTCRDTENSLLIYPNISDVSGLSSVASPSIRGERETRPPGNSVTGVGCITSTQDCNHSRLSSIPSLQRGDTIESSCTTINNFEDRSIAVESAFSRGKLYTKMMQLLDEMNPPQDISISDIVSMCASAPKGDGCSVAELKLIQKLTEEEMSRILREFERDNSLVDNKTVETEEINAVALFPADIRAGDDFSQVTSPTFADGVELDEVIHLPTRHAPTQRPAMNLLQSVLEIPMAERDQNDHVEQGELADIPARENGLQEGNKGHHEPEQEQSNDSGSMTESELELRNKTLAMSREHVRRVCEEQWMSNFATSTSAKDCELEEVTSILSYYEGSRARRMHNSNDVTVREEWACMDGIHDEGKNEDSTGPEQVSNLVESSAVTGTEKQPWGCGVVMCLG